ncbi:MAG TPA: helix-turn-helix domain-containing protein [Nevskiaceae bacterium]|nr:helix-turn-helix domain-containing protein [Nevskiaceae bacterium]
MARSSPSVLRVTAVLDFFADHPGQAFNLTDLVRSLKLSRATCHGLLTGLVESGYLFRTTEKSYVLGPALLRVAQVAGSTFSPLQVAQPEMRRLADAYDAVCSAAFREGHEVVVRERAAAVSHLGYSTPRGARLPLAPQFAAPFFASSTPAQRKAWIDGFNPPCSKPQAEAFAKGVEFVHAHGYMFSVVRAGVDLDRESAQWLAERRYGDTPILAKFELVPDEKYNLTFISAPVFDARQQVAFALALQGFHRVFSGAEIETIGARVREACDRITSFMTPPKEARG